MDSFSGVKSGVGGVDRWSGLKSGVDNCNGVNYGLWRLTADVFEVDNSNRLNSGVDSCSRLNSGENSCSGLNSGVGWVVSSFMCPV